MQQLVDALRQFLVVQMIPTHVHGRHEEEGIFRVLYGERFALYLVHDIVQHVTNGTPLPAKDNQHVIPGGERWFDAEFLELRQRL
uniref:Uncharacterized protein n=1 Tax=Anopheles atroparvus TaxID=41427 RepID=A0AAG5DG43_ANOAO